MKLGYLIEKLYWNIWKNKPDQCPKRKTTYHTFKEQNGGKSSSMYFIRILFFKLFLRRKCQPKQTYSVLEPDIEAALKDIEGADLSELAEILGETAIQR